MHKVNVLWVIDHVCYDGSLHGGGRLYWNILPRLDAERFNVVPCILRATPEIGEVFRDSPVPVRILDKGKYDPTTLMTFLRLIKQESIGVMHLHCYGASIFGRMASVISGVPCIIHDYDTAIYFPYPPYLWLADRLLARVPRRAIAASPMVRDYFIDRRGVPPDKISMAFHAIPSHKFRLASAERTARVRRNLSIAEGARVVGTVTKLGPQRGNAYLLRAAAKALREAPETVFVFVYKPTRFHRPPDRRYVDAARVEDEGDTRQLEALARELGIGKSVRFVEEEQNNVDELMGAFDVFVAPFLSQRFSSVNILEAMAMGKPVIATDTGEQQEIVESGRDGILVPVGDEDALAKTIVSVISRSDTLARLGREARLTARGYSVDAYVRRLQDWYMELVPESRKAGALTSGRAY